MKAIKNYKNSVRKREIQDEIFKQVENHSIVGLGGIDIDDYIDILEKHGFTDITLIERDFAVWKEQVHKFRHTLWYDDILNCLDQPSFYDLDFCKTIKSLEDSDLEKIAKIKEFSLTLSLRGVSLDTTLKRLYKFCGEIPYSTYRDSSPMITFFKH